MKTRIIPEIVRYAGGNDVLAAREEQKKKAWIRNVVRCIGMTEEEAERHWYNINGSNSIRHIEIGYGAPHTLESNRDT